jgi:ATP-binding cassette subfamily B protein
MEHRRAIDNLVRDPAKIAPINNLRPLLRYLRPYRKAAFGAFLALIFASSAVLGLGKGLQFLVDEGLSKGSTALLDQAVLVMLGIVLLMAVCTFLRFLLVTYVGENVIADIRRDLYSHLLNLSPQFYENTKTAEIISRLTTDASLLQMVVGSSLSVALRNILLLTGGLGLLFFTSPKLSGMVLIVVPLVVLPIIFLGRKVRALSRASQDALAGLAAQADETLHALQTVQSFTREAYENQRFTEKANLALKAAMARVVRRATLTALVIILIFSAVSFVVWVGGHDVLQGKMTAGALSSFLFYAVLVAGATGALSEVASDMQRAAGAAERLFELLAAKSSVLETTKPVALPQPLKGAVRFEDVSFTYPSATKASLEKISFTIESGEMLALVGPSGAGKSTIINLLLRFYDPDLGKIYLDDVEINNLLLQDLRAPFALVPQDPVIFSGTIAENISFGLPHATDAEIIKAAEIAAAMEFISRLDNGMQTLVGERGVRLSGGQKQRLAIARALLRNPRILLLDEATSSLDAANENLFQQALIHSKEGRTTLVIAHRLSTVMQSDRILFFNQGKIEASGTHQTLLQSSPHYREFVELQHISAG